MTMFNNEDWMFCGSFQAQVMHYFSLHLQNKPLQFKKIRMWAEANSKNKHKERGKGREMEHCFVINQGGWLRMGKTSVKFTLALEITNAVLLFQGIPVCLTAGWKEYKQLDDAWLLTAKTGTLSACNGVWLNVVVSDLWDTNVNTFSDSEWLLLRLPPSTVGVLYPERQ